MDNARIAVADKLAAAQGRPVPVEHSVTVIEATYSNPKVSEHRIDVTSTLHRMVHREGRVTRLHFKLGAWLFDTDPAPGVRKSRDLEFRRSWDPVIRCRSFMDDETIEL